MPLTKWKPEQRVDVIERICARLSKGEPFLQICRDEDMPSRPLVHAWCAESDDLAERIARAKDEGFDAIAEDCLRIADEECEDVQRAKLRVETRLKLLAKWDPKRYGDRQVIDMSVSQTISIRDALAQAERRVIDVVATPVLAPPDSLDEG